MIETTPSLIVFLIPLAYSPGPGNLFFAAAGARFGLGATLPALAGYHVATWVVTLAAGLGLAAAVGAAQAAAGFNDDAGRTLAAALAAALSRVFCITI